MRMAVGAVYHTVTRSSCRMRYQRSASKSASSTMLVMPFVRGAMIPYDVPVTHPGSAVHQKTSSLCRSSAIFAGHVMSDHGLMDVHGALGRAGRAARKVEQRHVFRVGWRHGEHIVRAGEARVEALRPGWRGRVTAHEDVTKSGQPGPDGCDLGLVELRRCHQDPDVPACETFPDGLRTERGEQRGIDTGVPERAERCHIEVRRSSAQQRADPVAPAHAKGGQPGGKAAGLSVSSP